MDASTPIARYQTPCAEDRCRCELCPRHCVIEPGAFGFCGHRKNVDGTLVAAQFGRVAALGVDPIEKKPLYHFFPGQPIASVGANGCNLACRFCQNRHLSEGRASTEYVSPVELAVRARQRGSIGLAFTYNEPTIWFEYILETAALLRDAGLKVVLVTNGYLEDAPWRELCAVVDAANIDVKGDERFYVELARGHVEPVRRNVETALAAGVHVEVTNLLVTGENDDSAQVRELVDWLAGVSPLIPLHLSRYFPQPHFEAPPTPMARLEAAVKIAREKLRYVYAGNAQLAGASDTHCHVCDAVVVGRLGYHTDASGLTAQGACVACGAKLPIVV